MVHTAALPQLQGRRLTPLTPVSMPFHRVLYFPALLHCCQMNTFICVRVAGKQTLKKQKDNVEDRPALRSVDNNVNITF